MPPPPETLCDRRPLHGFSSAKPISKSCSHCFRFQWIEQMRCHKARKSHYIRQLKPTQESLSSLLVRDQRSGGRNGDRRGGGRNGFGDRRGRGRREERLRGSAKQREEGGRASEIGGAEAEGGTASGIGGAEGGGRNGF